MTQNQQKIPNIGRLRGRLQYIPNEGIRRDALADLDGLIEQLETAEKRLAFFDRILALPSDLWVAALLAPADAPYPARELDT